MARLEKNKMLKKTGQQAVSIGLLTGVVLISLTLAGCSGEERSDAYGQFEATETTVSSELSGKLLQYRIDEGDRLAQDELVGYVDTTRLVLQRQELNAQLNSIRARIANINAEADVQREELKLSRTNLNRTQSMHADGAATLQQLDDAQSKVQTIQKRIDALQTQKQSIRADVEATRARLSQIEDQIDDAIVQNPVKGTVLTSFVEPFEIVQQGQPLYRIANLDTLTLRVYVSGARLPGIRLTQQVEVLVDKNAEENQAMIGIVRWIASEAEFTPQQIQTKEERVSQVYAVEVRVPNPDGTLKIGMPGEVNFGSSSAEYETNSAKNEADQ